MSLIVENPDGTLGYASAGVIFDPVSPRPVQRVKYSAIGAGAALTLGLGLNHWQRTPKAEKYARVKLVGDRLKPTEPLSRDASTKIVDDRYNIHGHDLPYGGPNARKSAFTMWNTDSKEERAERIMMPAYPGQSLAPEYVWDVLYGKPEPYWDPVHKKWM